MPPGIHEDVPVSATALVMAQPIALLDRVCYLYRRRSGSFLAMASMGHFDIFASYARVFAAVADAPAGAAVRAALFGRMLEHYSSILASGLVHVPRGGGSSPGWRPTFAGTARPGITGHPASAA
jgi:hypothetical protein